MAVAERPMPSAWYGSTGQLMAMDALWFDPSRLMPIGFELDPGKALHWVLGTGLLSGRPHLVPLDAVRLDGLAPDVPGICQHTNGLASGNSEQEAIFHACCELIERDAATIWSVRPRWYQAEKALDPAAFHDPQIDALVSRIAGANLELHLFDITSDLGIPTIRAIIGPNRTWRHFDLAEGTGTHPVAERAALRAITEAAQSRLTAIAGARDDIVVLDYTADAAAPELPIRQPASPPGGLPLGTGLPNAIAHLKETIATLEGPEPVVVNMGGEAFGISVVRVLSTELEDREANANWRPGARTVMALMETRT